MKDSKKELRLHEGELNVMELLWSNDVLAAKDIAKIIKEYIGWEKNTTYTVIKRLIDKGAILRQDPGFLCKAKVTKKDVQSIETNALLLKMYGGSLTSFITEYLAGCKLTTEQVIELQRVLNNQIQQSNTACYIKCAVFNFPKHSLGQTPVFQKEYIIKGGFK